MLSTLFGKKKLTEDKIANIFVNTILETVENSFADVATTIALDAEFVKRPQLDTTDSDKFLMIVVAGNFNYFSRYFSALEENVLKARIIQKFATVFGLQYDDMKKIISEYQDFIYRVNHPSKNTLYGMSKAVFFKYKLGQYQDNYFAQLNSPNPLFLKRMDIIMENYLWNWNDFLDKNKYHFQSL
jgi:hypothetical protein